MTGVFRYFYALTIFEFQSTMYHEPSHKAIDTSLELKYLLYRLYDLKSNPGMNCLQNWSLRDKKVWSTLWKCHQFLLWRRIMCPRDLYFLNCYHPIKLLLLSCYLHTWSRHIITFFLCSIDSTFKILYHFNINKESWRILNNKHNSCTMTIY